MKCAQREKFIIKKSSVMFFVYSISVEVESLETFITGGFVLINNIYEFTEYEI